MINPDTRIKRYWSQVQVKGSNDCWPWTGCKNQKGYGLMRWNGHVHNVHRFAWFLAHGEIPVGLHCLHMCNTPECQNPAHLMLGTNDANIEQKMKEGRHRGPRGERSATAKLRTEQVYTIRDRISSGEPYKAIAEDFGVCEGHISNIATNRTWKHLPERRMQSSVNAP